MCEPLAERRERQTQKLTRSVIFGFAEPLRKPRMLVTPEELQSAMVQPLSLRCPEFRCTQVPLGWRDECSHFLIPLNECRHKTVYAPWKCTSLRHAYEKCEYDCESTPWFPELDVN